MHDHDDPKATSHEQQIESHEPPPEAPVSSVGDQVLDILSGVEQQFDRLRQVQKGHDAELSSLKEHAQALEDAEQEAREELARLREQRVAVEHERQDVQAREADLAQRSEQIRAQLDEVERNRGELAESRSALGEKAERLQHDRDEHEMRQQEHLNELQALEDELSRDRQTHEEARTRIEQDRNAFDQERNAFDQERNAFEQDRNAFDQERNAFEHQRAQQEQVLAEREAEIERARREVDDRRQGFQEESDHIRQLEGQVNERSAQLDRQKEELESSRRTLEQQVRESREELEAIQQQIQEIETRTSEQVQAAEAEAEASRIACEDAKAEARAVHAEVEDTRTQLEHSDAKLTDAEEKLSLAGDRLQKFASILQEQAPQLEKGTAALAMVEHQRHQIERLTRQLAEASVGGATDEVNRKDERIAELTEALRQARGQAAGDQDVAELESQVAEMLDEVNRLRVENEQARMAAAQAKQALDERVEESVREGVNEAAVAEQEARNAELSLELERIQQALRDRAKESERADRTHEQQVLSLEQRNRELSDALEEARTAPAEGDDDEKATEALTQLRDKARRVNAVAEHLRHRQSRLKKMRRLLESREKRSKAAVTKQAPGQNMAVLEQRAADIRELEGQRKQLSEVKAMLQSSERAMIRRWARPKAIGATVWLFILVIMNGAIAWFATNHFFPAEVSASVSLAAQTRNGGKIDAEHVESWTTWHEDLITSEMFDDAVAKRMSERRLDLYRTGPAVHKRLHDDLIFERTKAGQFNLTLSGRDRGEVTAVLDVVALTLAAESTRQMGKRNDRARAVVQGERQEAGLIRYATVNSVPINDDRMKYLGPVFGVLMAISLLLVLGLYNHLLRAKRVFDEESAMIESGEPVEPV